MGRLDKERCVCARGGESLCLSGTQPPSERDATLGQRWHERHGPDMIPGSNKIPRDTAYHGQVINGFRHQKAKLRLSKGSKKEGNRANTLWYGSCHTHFIIESSSRSRRTLAGECECDRLLQKERNRSLATHSPSRLRPSRIVF